MFIIHSISVNGKEIKFLSTYNVFLNYCEEKHFSAEKIADLNKLIVKIYNMPSKTIIFETDYGFTEEIVLYDNHIFAFISSNSCKVLFNYLPSKNLFLYNSFPNLTQYQIEKIHSIKTESLAGNIKITLYNGYSLNYKVIYDYETFLYYCAVNELDAEHSYSKRLIFNDFLQSLTVSSINYFSVDPNFGLTAKSQNSPHIFNYVYFDNLMIITNYKKA
ncbi:hypothetical protein N4T77_02130 [Clostridium sp. CX1]|uniref:hypothetical protein n=1 Tax=Clostridium sp. CX1 TaxID=2978346 RepID=UPI0021BEA2DD|nr:hypothetical protein [Clostridium sp. CX1]MCT8975387.1 hypothetical protein [Clostridium sp. CX1]